VDTGLPGFCQVLTRWFQGEKSDCNSRKIKAHSRFHQTAVGLGTSKRTRCSDLASRPLMGSAQSLNVPVVLENGCQE